MPIESYKESHFGFFLSDVKLREREVLSLRWIHRTSLRFIGHVSLHHRLYKPCGKYLNNGPQKHHISNLIKISKRLLSLCV